MLPQSTAAGIRARCLAAGIPFRGQDCIAAALRPGDRAALVAEVSARVGDLLDALVIDQDEPNTHRTAERVARMFINEVFAGRYAPMPEPTDFPNAEGIDELYTVGPVAIRSACSHHLCPVEGSLWCGIIPGRRLVGLSKFSRLADWIMRRPHMQEAAVNQLADLLEQLLEPKGLALAMRLRHSCMTWRGVREPATTMTTNVLRGIFREAPQVRGEFFATIGGQGFA